MSYRDEDDILEILAEQYEEWLEENYTLTQIEDGDIISFDKWFKNKMDESSVYEDELDYA